MRTVFNLLMIPAAMLAVCFTITLVFTLGCYYMVRNYCQSRFQ